MLRPFPLFQADPGAPAGGSPTTPPAVPPTPAPTPAAPPAPAVAPVDPPVQGLLQRHQGDPFAVIATLMGENAQLREARRQLQGQIPAQGAVVLAGEDATRWQAYAALGAPAEVQAALAERDTTKRELTQLRRDLELRDVAAIGDGTTPYKLAVLQQLAGDTQFAIKEAVVGGRAVRSVVVKDGDKEVPLAEYAKARWADFLPALATAATRPAIGTPARSTTPAAPTTPTPDTPRRRITL